jgi:hypothetical protein
MNGRFKRKPLSFVLGLTVAAVVFIGAAQASSVAFVPLPTGQISVTTILRLANHGSARDQTYLGYMYETGRNFPQDYELAAYWYRCAAEQGWIHAQFLLGLLYDRGQGVPLNYVEALKWLNLAAAKAGSGDRDYFVRIRNAVASKLTRIQIYEAQRQARDWSLGRRP